MGLRRRWWVPAIAALVIVPAPGCAHSEDDWRAQLRTIGDLKARLDAEQAQAKKARADLDETTTKIEQLNQQLRTAGVDVANLGANLETQARATEEHRRRAEQLDATRRRLELLKSRLAPLSKQGLEVTVRHNHLGVQLPGDALFDAGRDTLKREGREVLVKLADALRAEPGLSARAVTMGPQPAPNPGALARAYQVACHVDAVSAGGPAAGRARDAFALSLLRAREVLTLLVQPADKGGGGLGPVGWSAAGYGAADPLKSNETPEGRQANRRCEIVLLPAASEVLDLRSLAP